MVSGQCDRNENYVVYQSFFIWNPVDFQEYSNMMIEFSVQVNYGSKNKKSSSTTYLHMLKEGHMIVRNALIGQQTIDEHLLDLYRESCGLLGEHYSL